jgi:hypothetical protein
MEHRTTLPDYPGGVEALVNDLGNLRYDSLANFLCLLSKKIDKDGQADLGRNRPQLSGHLMDASESISRAWTLCRPYMSDVEAG